MWLSLSPTDLLSPLPDTSQIIIPPHQYAILNSSYTLQCYSLVYSINSSWSTEFNSSDGITNYVTNSLTNVQLSNEGQYQCNVTLYGVSKLFNTTLHVLSKLSLLK